MDVLIVGCGKLAVQLLHGLPAKRFVRAAPRPLAIIHAGSGRELDEVIAYCTQHICPLIQASTGLAIPTAPAFPYICAPNLALPIVRLMVALDHLAPHFKSSAVELIESHQQAKKTVAGTAALIGAKFGLQSEEIISERNPEIQKKYFHVEEEHLGHHAIHQLRLSEPGLSISLETRVMGARPYVEGAKALVRIAQTLSPGVYSLEELICHNLL